MTKEPIHQVEVVRVDGFEGCGAVGRVLHRVREVVDAEEKRRPRGEEEFLQQGLEDGEGEFRVLTTKVAELREGNGRRNWCGSFRRLDGKGEGGEDWVGAPDGGKE